MVKAKGKLKKNRANVQKSDNFWSNPYFLLFLIVFASFIVYSYSLKCDFVNWDDPAMVTDNTQVRSELSAKSLEDIFSVKGMSNEYQPLTTLTYHLIYNVFELNPFYFHLFNIIFHLLNIILVFLFIKLLFNNINLALITAAFFAIHPLNVEVVAWISAANYILFSFFSLLSLIFYIKYIKTNYKIIYIVYSFVFFALAIFSKSTALMLPLLFFVIDYFEKRSIKLGVFFEKAPFLILSLASGLIALLLKEEVLSASTGIIYTSFDRIFFVFYSVCLYLFKIIFPFNLKIVYAYPEKVNEVLPLELYILPLLITIGIILIFILLKRERKLIVFSFFFFLINIIMVIHIIPFYHIGIIAERYVYLASLGMFVMLAHFITKWREEKTVYIKYVSSIIVVLYFAVLTINSSQRVRVWESDSTLFADLIKKNPDEPVSYNNLGNKEDKAGNYEKAIGYYNQAISVNSNYAEAFYNRGLSYYNLNKYAEAHTDFNKAIQINPNFAKAFNNRGTAKYFLSDKKGACKDWEKALALGYSEAKGNLHDFCKD